MCSPFVKKHKAMTGNRTKYLPEWAQATGLVTLGEVLMMVWELDMEKASLQMRSLQLLGGHV